MRLVRYALVDGEGRAVVVGETPPDSFDSMVEQFPHLVFVKVGPEVAGGDAIEASAITRDEQQ